ncbi:MAG: serine hydrolase [Chloroflexaceae bacterium]|nr:serine hydrolase [Chloroflexaceae bacterium]
MSLSTSASARLGLVLLLLALLVPAGQPPATQAAAGQPSPLFDSASTAWLSVRNLTSAQHQSFFNDQSNKGYMVIDIEGDEIDGAARYSSVWQWNSDGRGWASRRDLTSTEFGTIWQGYVDQGWRLIDQDVYTLDGQLRYAGVWMDNKEKLGWLSYRNVTSAQFAENFQTYSNDGFIMTDVEAYASGAAMLYAAVWVKNTENLAWIERRDLTSSEYADLFQQYKNQYRVLDLESYQRGGQQNYAAIWVENKSGRGWYAYRDLTAKQYGDTWLALRDEGYRLIDYEAYPTANGWRYAGIWRQNSNRPNWPLRDQITTKVQNYVDSNKLAGLSVAIAQNGQFVYLKGFGNADIAAQKPANSRTIYRLASVSKAVSGVLAMRLVQENLLNLNTATRTYAPTLPALHTHQVWQTLSNRSGVRHYGGGNDPTRQENTPGQYNTATAAAALFQNDPLGFTPGNGYTYSTHAYTLYCAALEGILNQSCGAIFNSRLSAPFDLPSLQAENRSVPNAFRASLYTFGNAGPIPIVADNISWKIAGGGLESSAYDLARMGIKLMNGSILSAQLRTTMWTRPDNRSNFALGWNTGTENGLQVVARNGSQAGSRSYIRMYPERNIVIVLLSNQSGHDLPTFGAEIGALVVGASPAAVAEAQGGGEGTAPAAETQQALPEELEPGMELGNTALGSPLPIVITPTATDFTVETDESELPPPPSQVFLPVVTR